MNWKNNLWKYATAFVVVLILLNPELAQLAFIIDAVGLEMFVLLLEIQLLTIISVFLNTKIKPLVKYLQNLFTRQIFSLSWRKIKKDPERLLLVAPGTAFVMHMLVFSASIGVVNNSL